jgi:hypothetical protein
LRIYYKIETFFNFYNIIKTFAKHPKMNVPKDIDLFLASMLDYAIFNQNYLMIYSVIYFYKYVEHTKNFYTHSVCDELLTQDGYDDDDDDDAVDDDADDAVDDDAVDVDDDDLSDYENIVYAPCNVRKFRPSPLLVPFQVILNNGKNLRKV